MWIGVRLLKGGEGEQAVDAGRNLLSAVRTILVADFVMSLDNVLAVAAVAAASPPNVRLVVLVIGLGLTVPLIMFGSTLLLVLIRRFPVIVVAGAALLGFVAGEMAAADPALGAFGVERWSTAIGAVVAVLVVVIGKLAARGRRAPPTSG